MADRSGFQPSLEATAFQAVECSPDQIIAAIRKRVGIHPHQFRPFGAMSYLAVHPEDFETVRQMLRHAWSKTSRIYAGDSSQRAIGAHHQVLFAQCEAMKFKRPRRTRR